MGPIAVRRRQTNLIFELQEKIGKPKTLINENSDFNCDIQVEAGNLEIDDTELNARLNARQFQPRKASGGLTFLPVKTDKENKTWMSKKKSLSLTLSQSSNLDTSSDSSPETVQSWNSAVEKLNSPKARNSRTKFLVPLNDTSLKKYLFDKFKNSNFDYLKYYENNSQKNIKFNIPSFFYIPEDEPDYLEFLGLILDQKADVNELDQNGQALLHYVVLRRCIKVFDLLMTSPLVIINIKNSADETPLHLAVTNGNIVFVEKILSYLLHKITDDEKFTLMQIAIIYGHLELLKYLHKKFKFDLNRANKEGHILLHVAACSGQVECLDYLLRSGSKINSQDEVGLTPYHIAALYKHPAIMSYLRECRGINLNLLDNYGNTGDFYFTDPRFKVTVLLGI